MNILSLDFGGTSLKYGIVNEAAEIRLQNSVAAPLGSVREYLDTIVSLYHKYQDEIDGIAISMPGKIHSDFGIIETAGSYTEIENLDIFAALKNQVTVPVSIENDGKCGALAELWKGGLEAVDDGIVITIGTAVGGAIIIGGKIHYGKDLSAGEISFMMGRPGEYGLKDRVGTINGMSGLILRVTQAMGISATAQKTLAVFRNRAGIGKDICIEEQLPDEEKNSMQVDGQLIFQWVKEKNPVVVPLYREFIQNLAMLIYNLYAVFDPEKILIGGGISNQEMLIMDLNEEIARISSGVSFAPIPKINIEACHFKSEANLIGAVYHFFEKHGDIAAVRPKNGQF